MRILLLILSFMFFFPSNEYYQTTKVTFEGIQGECYGTLLSKTSESGSWAHDKDLDLNAPTQVVEFFKNYEDEDHFFYLNFIQDVSGGLLYWPSYPPETFKVLLYYPESDTYLVGEPIMSRYALTSMYKATIQDNQLIVERNYDYFKMFRDMVIRIVLCSAITIIVSLWISKPRKIFYKYYIISTILFQILLNIPIVIYSYLYGFSLVEYLLFMWLPYLLMFFLQSHLYSSTNKLVYRPYISAFFGNVAAYVLGLLLLDFIPSLFTII